MTAEVKSSSYRTNGPRESHCDDDGFTVDRCPLHNVDTKTNTMQRVLVRMYAVI